MSGSLIEIIEYYFWEKTNWIETNIYKEYILFTAFIKLLQTSNMYWYNLIKIFKLSKENSGKTEINLLSMSIRIGKIFNF